MKFEKHKINIKFDIEQIYLIISALEESQKLGDLNKEKYLNLSLSFQQILKVIKSKQQKKNIENGN
mgnify:CR=1 FL=1